MLTRVISVLTLAIALVGCHGKPSEEDCKRAVANIQRVNGIEGTTNEVDTLAAVRKCRADSSKESALCIAAAKTPSDIDACSRR
jgi:hypothetical protein